MWNSVIHSEDNNGPCSRSKHSVTFLGKYLYVLAGRNVNVPLKDFWRFDLTTNEWELLKPNGDCPPSLQEHTAVPFRNNIYVFGGELSFSAGNETPLWVYESKKNLWRKMRGQKGASVPKGRRGHTTLVHHSSALIYGGYCDLRGSSNEFWIFHFDTESWHLLMNGKTSPPARHKHSSVLHDGNMWIYGGMTDLQERSDLWRFDLTTKTWFSVKCKFSPGPLHSHAACKLPSSMLLFGGERNGQLINELWRFHFGTETWQRIQTGAVSPQPISECCAVTVSELLLQNKAVTGVETNTYSDYPSVICRERLCSTEMIGDVVKNANENANHHSRFNGGNKGGYVMRDISWLENLPLTSSGNAKLVYLEDEKATVPGVDDFFVVHQQLRPNRDCNLHNFPKTNATQLVNPLVILKQSSSDITSGYASCENIHKLLSSSSDCLNQMSCGSGGEDGIKTSPHQESSSFISFSNQSYLNNVVASIPTTTIATHSAATIIQQQRQQQMGHVQEKISKRDYIILNSPADSLLEDSASSLDIKFEMAELRPKPSELLPLRRGSGAAANCNTIMPEEIGRKYRASNAGHYECQSITSLCVFFIGGKDPCQVTSFKRPISIWRLSLTRDIY